MKFKQYLEESEHLKKAEEAILAGDYETALKHLAKHVPGKNRRKDALAARLQYRLKQGQK